MQSIKFRITGTTPLMLNNPQTVNPMNHFTKELKAITSKRNKTDEDQDEIFHLKFLSCCYLNKKGQYILPSNNIWTSFWEAAKEFRLGKKFEESVVVVDDALLKFADNGCSPEELWQNHADKYVDIRNVGIKKSQVTTARFIIPEWSLEGELVFDENQLNKSEVWLSMTNAGLRKGVGTYRRYYGRYKIEEIKDDSKKKK